MGARRMDEGKLLCCPAGNEAHVYCMFVSLSVCHCFVAAVDWFKGFIVRGCAFATTRLHHVISLTHLFTNFPPLILILNLFYVLLFYT